MVKIKHLITKKIDESNALTLFFGVVDRPKGMFKLSFIFTRQDGSKFKCGIEAEGLTKAERILHKKDKNLEYGFFPVVVPDGAGIVHVSFRAKYGNFGHILETTEIVPLSSNFEDVTKYEKLYERQIKKLL